MRFRTERDEFADAVLAAILVGITAAVAILVTTIAILLPPIVALILCLGRRARHHENAGQRKSQD